MTENSARVPKNRQFTLAGFRVDPKLLLGFADSFERLNASILTVHLRSGQIDDHRHINACVLPLDEAAVDALKRCTWFVPRRTVVYGIGSAKEAARFVELGINALLQTSSDASIRTAVDATQSLLSRGVGACGRVPISTLVGIDTVGRTLTGVTKNVGSGGMAVRLLRKADLPEEMRLHFVLPHAGSFSLKASPRWYSGLLVGLRFQPSPAEEALKRWVKDYASLGLTDRRSLRARGTFA